MRKDRNLRTYGRHKNRVIVTDTWLPDSDKKKGGVFSTSSDDSSRQASIFQSSSSSENGALSLNSTGNSDHSLFSSKSSKIQTRSTRKVRKAENKENENPKRQTRNTESKQSKKEGPKANKQIFTISSSTDCSIGSEKTRKTRALRDRNQKIDYNDSANLKKQLRGVTAKRKRAVRTCNNSKACHELSVNFSDFDNYSLVISDSPPVDVKKGNNKVLSVETSTPVAKRTRRKDAADDNMKVTDISHIEIVPSPGTDADYTDINTPESVHSQSLFNTPSVLSSNCSEDASSWSKRTDKSSNGMKPLTCVASIELQKLRESFISSVLSEGVRANLAESRMKQVTPQSQAFNNSESLFSPADRNLEKNVSLLTERLKQVRCGQLYNDSVTEENSDVTDNDSGEESDENSCTEEDTDESESEDNETNDDVSRDGDLSAIHEDEEASDDKSDGENDIDEDSDTDTDSENNETESDSEQESDSGRRVTRNQDKNSKSNLDRLSESLLMNHVNRRRTTKSTRVRQSDSDIDDLAECLDNSHIDSSGSNCTLYMLNDENSVESRQSGSMGLSVHEEEECEEDSEEGDSLSKSECKSAYHTAHSSRQSDYHTAEDDVDDDDENDVSEGEQMEEDPCTPPRKKYSLRGKFQDLQSSFSELLTPKRKKSSMVPLSAQARVLVLCDQTEAITFSTALSKKMISKCKKIGEGVYGEVFRSFNTDGEAVAIKVIPIEGDFEVNDEPQKKFAEILPEVVIAKELSNLRSAKSSITSSFCQVNNVSCVKGKYPTELIRQWDLFHKNKGSENDRPDVFPDKQLYIVFEFADCGTDLESYKFDSIQQAKSVLTQVAYALAVAEESLQFEHRDLHWGNVLVRPTEKEDITFKLLGKPITVPSQGVEASVIDFTMSRLTKDGCTVYITIPDDDTLFDGQGDYQFDIYREMKKENKGNWETFCSHSNVLWLHYLADKLVYSTRYPNQSGRQEREILREFRQFMSTMLDYRSACEMSVDSLFLNS
ncbi:uncharacterized protein LOC123546503 [Mercenaria mercenaria]|uniref:uncharacterized protein LOC123546503 n=1 Tax=Mercenaria mercenaria TaxID=6596 RepID=UPI00234F1438|nr:uncharacterized protein LOC123546503 [Mercenaria mercenaria]XP_045188776.2 uncharacterized protein LOC123546503 [Mercenaria mercenaria]